MNKGFSKLVAALALATALSAAAVEISVEPNRPNVGEAVTVSISGSWPNACAPEFSHSAWQGDQLLVFATAEAQCTGDPSSYTIQLDAEPDLPDGEVVQLKFLIGEPDAAVGQLHGFELVGIGSGHAWQPESGIWWPAVDGRFGTSGPGVALSFEFIEDEVVSITSAYDRSGQPSWVLGSGRLTDGIARGRLTKILGGQQLFETYRSPQQELPDGNLFLKFHSPTKATVWLSAPAGPALTDGLLLQPISIEHYASKRLDQFIRGRWVIVDEGSPSQSVAVRFDYPVSLAPAETTGNAEFISTDGAAILNCEGQLESVCLLAVGERSFVFDQIGLDRMRGTDAAGNSVTAIKLD